MSVQIEHVRDAFSSVQIAQQEKREREKANDQRAKRRDDLARELRDTQGLEHVRDSDLRRMQAITRQGGICLYCGGPITFRTCEMDHIVPRKGVGSTNTRENFAAVCEVCNRMKTNTPFAVWARTADAKNHGVSLKDAVTRVKGFLAEPGMSPKQLRHFQQAVIARLKQTEEDDPIDNRSMESVAWMADELHRRIDWHYNAWRYSADGHRPDDVDGKGVRINVYRGAVTAEARKASGIDGMIHFIGSHRKTRLDRRHHAVDAAVITMMTVTAAQVLEERASLRFAQNMTDGHLEPGEVPWKEYPAPSDPHAKAYMQWKHNMHLLVELLNDALDNDRIPVLYPQRYALGNSIAHDATIHPLLKVRLEEAMDAEIIRKASTPALYCALTRLPDYSEKDGLPANPERTITVNGRHFGPEDHVEFFQSNAAQIKVQGGSAEIGSAIHHARVYRCYKENAKGKRTYFYGMVRVFQMDLLRASHEDLFTYPLPPQSVSMRYAELRIADAVKAGHCEYMGYLVVGDEIEIDFEEVPKGKIGSFVNSFVAHEDVNSSATKHWLLSGFYSATQLRLRPAMISAEGIEKFVNELDNPDFGKDIETIMAKGWIAAINSLPSHAQIIRRNALGEMRFHSNNEMPTTWGFAEGIA